MDTTELVSWFRMAQIDPYFGTAIQGRFEQAADTIERLQKERDQLGAGGKVWQRTAGHLKQERDAALAEVERLEKRVETERSKAPLRSWTCVPCQSLFPLHSRGRPICSKCGELMSESA